MSQQNPEPSTETPDLSKESSKKARKSPPPYEPPRLVKFDQLEKLIVSGE